MDLTHDGGGGEEFLPCNLGRVGLGLTPRSFAPKSATANCTDGVRTSFSLIGKVTLGCGGSSVGEENCRIGGEGKGEGVLAEEGDVGI